MAAECLTQARLLKLSTHHYHLMIPNLTVEELLGRQAQ